MLHVVWRLLIKSVLLPWNITHTIFFCPCLIKWEVIKTLNGQIMCISHAVQPGAQQNNITAAFELHPVFVVRGQWPQSSEFTPTSVELLHRNPQSPLPLCVSDKDQEPFHFERIKVSFCSLSTTLIANRLSNAAYAHSCPGNFCMFPAYLL